MTYNSSSHKILLYNPLFRVISVCVNIFIFLVGMIGNILVIVVVIRTKTMHTPTNCYLISLSVADCLVLVSATLPAIPETFFQINEWPFGRTMCSLLVFLQYLGVDMSSLSITAFTVERYIAICHPLKSQTVCTVRRAKRIIAGLWLFGVLYCSPWLGLTVLKYQRRSNTIVEFCDYRLTRNQYLAIYLTDFFLFYIIPLLIAGLLYGLIARILVKSHIPKDSDSTRNGFSRASGSSRLNAARIQVCYFFLPAESICFISLSLTFLFRVLTTLRE